MSARQTPESFWARVDVRGPDECWPWKGGTNAKGYGTVAWNGTGFLTHRVAAWLYDMVDSPAGPTDRKGPGFVLHQCDNPPCCNPAHFRIGTMGENQKEAYERGLKAPPRGPDHTNAKLSSEDVPAIRAAYATGTISQDALAAQYGVSQRVISLIVRGLTYKEVA